MSQKCRGYTLIETITSLSLIGVTLTAVVLTLHGLYGVDQRLRDGFAAEAGLDRLTRALRQDVHYAHAAHLSADGPDRSTTLELTMPAGGRVTYTLNGERIERVAQRRDRHTRETFRVAAAGAWEIDSKRSPALVTLRLQPTAAKRRTGNLQREIRVVAAAGLMRAPITAAASTGENAGTAPPSTGESP